MNRVAFMLSTLLLCASTLHAQQVEALHLWQDPLLQLPGRASAPPPPRLVEATPRNGPTALLYRALRSVELDETKVFHVREAALDRGELHLYLTDGTIAFTQDVQGRVTGAYFEGDGEVLMRPPNLTEHASLGLFSGMGILDERFSAAYFRFNEDMLGQLKPYLRETENQREFVEAHGQRARELSELDALRLLESFMEDEALSANDHFLHARLATRLGSLDVYDDSQQEDQFTVACLSHSGESLYFDVWMAFPGRQALALGEQRVIDPAGSTSAVPVNAFRIDTVLKPPEMLEASAELDLEVKTGGQKLLTFELSRWLQVSSVTVDGAEAEFLQNDALTGSELARIGNDLVTVVIPAILRKGEHHRLRFHYAGAVMQQAAPGLLYVGARGTWYPNRGLQMSLFDLKFRWPRDWTLVATGHPSSIREDGETNVGAWSSEGKIPIAGFNLGKFVRATAQTDGITVSSYTAGVVEESLAKAAPVLASESPARNAAIAQRSAEAIQKYTHWFGSFPFRNLALTQFPSPVSQGWPTLVYLSSFAYLSDQERRTLKLNEFQRLVYGGFMQDHETAHQWWGDRVGWKSYRDQWLMEALASLSALMIMEEKRPADARALLACYRQELLANNAKGKSFADAGPVTLGYRLSSSVFPNAYIPVTYGRGLWLLIMLRDYFADYEKLETEADSAQHISSEGRFIMALREFVRRYDHSTATTDDFRKVLEEFLPPKARYEGRQSLKWFFDEWVRGSSVPEIELKHVMFLQRRGVKVASFSINQERAPESLVTSVPIFAELAGGGQVFLQRVFADGHETHLQLNVPRGTQRLIMDPGKRLLRLY
ncbi:MAG TPA: M1 family aminopeptidase [Candidatus Saccharimonadales bacterium]|nr:M1 family aminopeptidase [Candidatus Saccharimonadales bacterium]